MVQEKSKKAQAFPFLGSSPGREAMEGKRGWTARGREEEWKKSGDASLFLACFDLSHFERNNLIVQIFQHTNFLIPKRMS